MYWELGNQQAVRRGDWKLYRRADRDGKIAEIGLFNLAEDPGEQNDLSGEQPDLVAALVDLAARTRTVSEVFPSPFDAETIAATSAAQQQ